MLEKKLLDLNLTLDYHFGPAEIVDLAKFLRKNEEVLPDSLIKFSSSIEKIIYENLSIDEAETFYS